MQWPLGHQMPFHASRPWTDRLAGAGYLDADGNRLNSGVRHPYGFLDGDWLYVFYLDVEHRTGEQSYEVWLHVSRDLLPSR